MEDIQIENSEQQNQDGIKDLDPDDYLQETEGVMSQNEYYDLYNKLPHKALVPLCELIKPGGVIFTEDNIHLLPFGCNMVPFEDNKNVLNVELKLLKLEAGLLHVEIPLELAAKKELNSYSDKELIPISQCALCNEQANYKCQNCLSVAYCGREHQLAHWKDHRPFCVLYEVVDNPTADGYHIVAKTNIKKGEAIFIEQEPYFVSPFSMDEHFRLLNFQPISDENQRIQVGGYTVEEFETNICRFPMVCVGCSAYLSPENCCTCDVCGWPICEKECKELAKHCKWECAYFKENIILYEQCRKTAVFSPRIIGVIRALLVKKRDPKKWDRLLNDISENIWKEKTQADMSSRVDVEYLLVVLRNAFGFQNLEYSEICNILAVIELKGIYGCHFEQQGDKCRRIICVYHVASLIRHRCIGNVFTIQTSSGALHVIAAKAIKKGEPLYRNYNNSQGDMLHVLHRQHFAMSIINKPCDCRLCVDINMGENSLSAIVCLKCKRRGFENYMMVETPTKVDSLWKCNKCNSKKSTQQVRNLLQDITKDLEYFSPDLNIEEVLRSSIAKYKGVVLHREHSIILSAEFDLIFYMMEGDRLASLNLEETCYLVQLLNTRIKNLIKFIPDAHSSVISMKMRLATVMVYQAYRGYLGSKERWKAFEDLQFIHDDIAQSFVENTKANALQEYLLICLRKMRKLMAEVGTLFMEERRRINLQAMHLKLSNAKDVSNLSSSDQNH